MKKEKRRREEVSGGRFFTDIIRWVIRKIIYNFIFKKVAK